MPKFFVLERSLWVVLSSLFVVGAARADAPPSSAPAQQTPAVATSAPPNPPADVEPAGYRELVEEAVLEYERGNFEEAHTLFTRAHLTFPNARTHRGIGKAEFELRNYESCVAHLEAALHSNVRPLTPELRADTEQLLGRARHYFGSLLLETRPAASATRVDGTPVEAIAGRPLQLRVGEHVVEVDAPGYVTERRQISVRGGAPEQLVVVFARPLAPASKDERGRRWYASPWLWTAVGVVAAGAAAGAAVAATRDGEKPGPYDVGSTGILGKAP